MPTARELLEQADALMRRNRKHGRGRLGDVPTLTDAPGVDADASLAPTVILSDAHAGEADPIVPDTARGINPAPPDPTFDTDAVSLDTLADVPVLTDAVLVWPPDAPLPERAAVAGAPVDAGDAFPASAAEAEAIAAQLQPPAVLEQETSDGPPAPSDDAPDGVPSPPAARALDDDFILEIPPSKPEAPAAMVDDSPIPSVVDATTIVPGSLDWDALAEEIRMQVLQRLDLFTDTGLREQLGARLSPIVERASAALVETINRELGQLVRGYVAEAIEREIESWRSRGS